MSGKKKFPVKTYPPFRFFTNTCSQSVFHQKKNFQIYSHGYNIHAQLNVGDKVSKHTSTLIKNSNFYNPKNDVLLQVGLGYHHTLFLLKDKKTKKKKVCGIGLNQFGELALGNVTAQANLVHIPFFDDKGIVQLFAGHESSFFLCNLKGKDILYCSGNNTTGKLGTNDKVQKNVATAVKLADMFVKDLCSTKDFSLILSEKGELYWTGKLLSKELLVFTRVEGMKVKFKRISAGFTHFLALTEGGKVFGSGSNAHKQLSNVGDKETPFELPVFTGESYVDVKCGFDFSIVLSENGKAFSLGAGNNYQHGNNDPADKEAPVLLKENVAQIGSGRASTYLICNNGDIWTTGGNDQGQLGIGNLTHPIKVWTKSALNSKDLKEYKPIRTFPMIPNVNLVSLDSKIFTHDYLEIHFKNSKKVIKIECCMALRSPILKKELELMKGGKGGLKNILEDQKYIESVFQIRNWLHGSVPKINNFKDYKNTYTLAKKWGLFQLSSLLVDQCEGLKDENVISMLFMMEEEEEEKNSALYLKCLHILKKKHKVLFEDKLFKQIRFLSENKKCSELLQVIMSLPYNNKLAPLLTHPELKTVERPFDRQLALKKHIYSLLEDKTTKNMCYLTVDKVYIKAHIPIIEKSGEFKSTLPKKFKHVSDRIVNINASSKILTPIIMYIYTEKVDLDKTPIDDLLLLSSYAKSFKLDGLKKLVDEEISLENMENEELMKKNVFLEKEINELKYTLFKKGVDEKGNTLVTPVEKELKYLKDEVRSEKQRVLHLEKKLEEMSIRMKKVEEENKFFIGELKKIRETVGLTSGKLKKKKK